MTTMISEVYAAFKSIGIDDAIAQKAAEALSSESLATKNDLARVEKELKQDIASVKTDIAVLKWMMGFTIAGVASIVIKTFI